MIISGLWVDLVLFAVLVGLVTISLVWDRVH